MRGPRPDSRIAHPLLLAFLGWFVAGCDDMQAWGEHLPVPIGGSHRGGEPFHIPSTNRGGDSAIPMRLPTSRDAPDGMFMKKRPCKPPVRLESAPEECDYPNNLNIRSSDMAAQRGNGLYVPW